MGVALTLQPCGPGSTGRAAGHSAFWEHRVAASTEERGGAGGKRRSRLSCDSDSGRRAGFGECARRDEGWQGRWGPEVLRARKEPGPDSGCAVTLAESGPRPCAKAQRRAVTSVGPCLAEGGSQVPVEEGLGSLSSLPGYQV